MINEKGDESMRKGTLQTIEKLDKAWRSYCKETTPLLMRFRTFVETSGWNLGMLTEKMLDCGFLQKETYLDEDDYISSMYWYLTGEFGFPDDKKVVLKEFLDKHERNANA